MQEEERGGEVPVGRGGEEGVAAKGGRRGMITCKQKPVQRHECNIRRTILFNSEKQYLFFLYVLLIEC